MSNAIDETQDQKNPWIKIDSVKNDKNTIIRIENSGELIADENIKKIFNPFFTTKEIGKGTGLGLSLSTKIMEKHNGKLNLDQSSGIICFVLEFPNVEESMSIEQPSEEVIKISA